MNQRAHMHFADHWLERNHMYVHSQHKQAVQYKKKNFDLVLPIIIPFCEKIFTFISNHDRIDGI